MSWLFGVLPLPHGFTPSVNSCHLEPQNMPSTNTMADRYMGEDNFASPSLPNWVSLTLNKIQAKTCLGQLLETIFTFIIPSQFPANIAELGIPTASCVWRITFKWDEVQKVLGSRSSSDLEKQELNTKLIFWAVKYPSQVTDCHSLTTDTLTSQRYAYIHAYLSHHITWTSLG